MGRRILGAASLACCAVLLALVGVLLLGAPAARARSLPSQVTAAPSSAAPSSPAVPATTIAPLGAASTVAPATLPLRTKGSNAHVSPVLAILSGVGFLVALLMIVVRMIVTRPGGPDRRPYPVDTGEGSVTHPF
jgi:hypothetical protein